jgi:pyruvate dehydrogenase E2 component (dihydrolipoamide acetyltransferase)
MDIIMPQLGETVLEGIITAWYKKPGEAVAADESLFEVETEKVSTAIPSPVPGVVREILVDTGVSVKVGTRLAVVETFSEVVSTQGSHAILAGVPLAVNNLTAQSTAPQISATDAAVPPAPQRSSVAVERDSDSKLSPLVRRLLAESGLRPDQVRGTGRDGRITKEDMLNHIAGAPSQLPPAPADRVVPLNKIRRATAAHMVRSIAISPHTLQAVEVNFQNVDRARHARAADWKVQEGFTLTYLPFVCAAVCEALVDFPYINATFGDDALIVHQRINLGIAVDVGFEGLLVPVLHDANHRSVRGLARKINILVQKARSNTLAADDLSGGTYTVSNSGSFGTLITAPIINQPQVAILSLDGVHKKPTVVESPDGDAIAIRPVGVLAQSFDHRAFDGAYSAAFLRRLKQALETRNWLNELN